MTEAEPVVAAQPDAVCHLGIGGMSCAACVARVEKALRSVAGVREASVDLVGHGARVVGAAARADLERAVAAAGYQVVPEASGAATSTVSERVAALEAVELAEARSLDRDLKWALALAPPVLVLGMSHGILPHHLALMWAQALLTLAVVALPGRRFLAGAWKSARARSADMSTLVALGVLSAVGYSTALLVGATFAGGGAGHAAPAGAPALHLYFEAAAAIILFVLIGKRLEARARRHLSAAVRGLVGLVPERVQRLVAPRDEDDLGGEETVELARLAAGDVVRVRPGGRVPADGEVVAGRAAVDEAALTGESLPVERGVGARVQAGTLVTGGALDIRVDALGDDSAIGRIASAVEAARSDKAPVARMADRVAAVFVPIVVAVALATLVVHLALGAPEAVAVERFLTVLIIACPCALGLATPAAVSVGAGRAAELGILVKGGSTFEALAHVDRVLFDKTGTLTQGTPEVARIRTVGSWTEEALLAYAAAAERASEHPLGRAIVRHAEARGVGAPDASEVRVEVGGGVRATVAERAVAVGSAAFVGVTGEASRDGLSEVLVTIDGELAGTLSLGDAPRPEARAVIEALHGLGLEVELLSGDRQAVVDAVAGGLGIDHPRGELSPNDKLAHITRLRAEGHVVAMVGDGVNDAPALAAANVGVALQSGTDIANHSADVVLTHTGLERIVAAIRIARRTMRVIRQNLFWAFAYNVLGIPLAAGVFAVAIDWTLDPVYASFAMALSSVSVVLNALRLRRAERDEPPLPVSRARAAARRSSSASGLEGALRAEETGSS